MKIVIPSKGRASLQQQVTLRNFIRFKSARRPTIVVPFGEKKRYDFNVGSAHADIVETPEDVRGISGTRSWILQSDWGDPHVLMIDDDMDFSYRPDMSNVQLVPVDQSTFEIMLQQLEHWLKIGFVHVGVSARQGNNTHPAESGRDHVSGFTKGERMRGVIKEYRDATRMMNMYAYDTAALRELKVEFGRVEVMEDFDLTLQLLRLGRPNRVAYNFVWNQRGSGKEGGCSTYRTPEVQAMAAHRLATLHAPFVKVVTKGSKSSSASWKGMKERVDVDVYWLKAFDSAPEAYTPVEVVVMSKTRRSSR